MGTTAFGRPEGSAAFCLAVVVNHAESFALIRKKNAPLPPTFEETLEKGKQLKLSSLYLYYRVGNHQGWYCDNDDFCYYLYVVNHETEEFRVIFAGIKLSQLNFIVRQVEMGCRGET